jgi:hypothetical protein
VDSELYRPALKYVKKAYVIYERVHHGSKSQFNSEEEEQLYQDYLPGKTIFKYSYFSAQNSELSKGAVVGKILDNRT